jgi:hypothetical protein
MIIVEKIKLIRAGLDLYRKNTNHKDWFSVSVEAIPIERTCKRIIWNTDHKDLLTDSSEYRSEGLVNGWFRMPIIRTR